MEKFRKFDDPSCGVNPFVPLPTSERPVYFQLPRMVSESLLALTIAVVQHFHVHGEIPPSSVHCLPDALPLTAQIRVGYSHVDKMVRTV